VKYLALYDRRLPEWSDSCWLVALADPPFSRMDLISCRNVLIYLEPVLQRRVMPTLHYALKPGGCLWLGGSETIGSYRNLFDAEDPRHKIYTKRPGTVPGHGHFQVQRSAALRAPFVTSSARPSEPDMAREADRILLARYAPASVLVSAELDILHYRGDTSPYLAPMPGKASLNLLKMLREGLLVAVRAAVLKAGQEHTAVREEGLRVKGNGGYSEVNLEVLPVRGHASTEVGFLVLFEAATQGTEGMTSPREQARAAPPDVDHGRLELELAATREYLQLVIEQQEAANEELQSANEEVQSANEELQSTNEELETSKEEIQSSNEELATVNDELNNRNAELHRVNDDLINLLTSVQMAIVILGPDLCVRRFTPTAERLLNLVSTDIGRPLTDGKLRLEGVANLESLLLEVLDTVSARDQDVRDKLGRWYSLRLRPYRTLANKIDGVVMMLVDIDAMKRVQDRMGESEEELQRNAADMAVSDRRKDEFLAMLAHELRNPLAPIRNALEILRLTDGNGQAVRSASVVMERHVGQIVRLMDDLLDVSRISRGTVELRRERVELAPSIHHAVEAAHSIYKKRNHELTVSLPARPIVLEADPTRLAQVVGNLLNNACKFTDNGGHIRLSVEQEGEQAVIRVSDSGIGIAADRILDIFGMFVQVDTSRARSSSGLGIGLTLVKSLVEMHSGSITAHSPGPGAGSTFIVRLPLAPDDATAPAPAPAPAGDIYERVSTSHRILVVDDNEDAAETIATLLELWGHRTATAHNGPDALDMARRFGPDLAFLDIGLPGMSGYEVARRFRAEPALERTVLVALTGWGNEDDRRRSREAGFDFHLTKPAEPSAIHAALVQLLAVRSQPTTGDGDGSDPRT